jgi:hypothetical protein
MSLHESLSELEILPLLQGAKIIAERSTDEDELNRIQDEIEKRYPNFSLMAEVVIVSIQNSSEGVSEDMLIGIRAGANALKFALAECASLEQTSAAFPDQTL